jgi:hypothetical protein
MKKVLFMVVALGVVMAFAQAGIAQVGTPVAKDAIGPGPVVAQSATSTAIVAAIDFEHRIATIRLPDGTTTTFKAGPEVSGFDQLKVGDQVLVRN